MPLPILMQVKNRWFYKSWAFTVPCKGFLASPLKVKLVLESRVVEVVREICSENTSPEGCVRCRSKIHVPLAYLTSLTNAWRDAVKSRDGSLWKMFREIENCKTPSSVEKWCACRHYSDDNPLVVEVEVGGGMGVSRKGNHWENEETWTGTQISDTAL